MKTKLYLILIALMLALSATACTSAPKKIPTKTVITIDERIYDSCPRPTTVLQDYQVETKEQLNGKSEIELDALTFKAYGNTKQDHLACYKTLANVKAAYDQLKLTIGN